MLRACVIAKSGRPRRPFGWGCSRSASQGRRGHPRNPHTARLVTGVRASGRRAEPVSERRPLSLCWNRYFAAASRDRQRLPRAGPQRPATEHQPCRQPIGVCRTRIRAPRRGNHRNGASSTPLAHRDRVGPARWRSSPTATPPRATTPSAVPNGASVSSSPCATAASTVAGTSDSAGHDVDQHLQPRPDLRVRPRTPEPVVVDQVRGGQRVQPRERLQRRRLPHPDQRRRTALQRLRHPQRTGQHRVGLAGLGQLQRAAVEHRRRPRGPQRRLGGGRRPAAQVGAVPVALPSASRASSPAAATPGSSASGANGCDVIAVTLADHWARNHDARAQDAPPAGAELDDVQHRVTTLTACPKSTPRLLRLPAVRPTSPRRPTRPRAVRRGRGRPAGVLGEAGRTAVLGHPVRRGAGLVGRPVREVVRRRQAQRRLQLRRPPCRGRQR